MKGGVFVKVMLVLVFLALVANLVTTAVRGESFITTATVKLVAFWALFAANLCIAGAGIYFTTSALSRHERSSMQWGRWGFLLNLVLAAVFSLAPWFFYEITAEFSITEAMFEISLILLFFGLSQGIFLYSFYRDYSRGKTAHPRGSTRRHTRHLETSDSGRRSQE